ncbi:MAG: hypothetical protein P9L97_06640 [Candidatus Tenebribacter davisii]|nr:hypothetical protein [Candidatus Tenebribacter davisii]
MDNVSWDSEVGEVPVELVSEITDIYEINNEYRHIYCFTITLRNQQIINVTRIFNTENNKDKKTEIGALHSVISNKFNRYLNQKNNRE